MTQKTQKFIIETYVNSELRPRAFSSWETAVEWVGSELTEKSITIGVMHLNGKQVMSRNELRDAATAHREMRAVNSGSGELWREFNAKRFAEWSSKARECGW